MLRVCCSFLGVSYDYWYEFKANKEKKLFSLPHNGFIQIWIFFLFQDDSSAYDENDPHPKVQESQVCDFISILLVCNWSLVFIKNVDRKFYKVAFSLCVCLHLKDYQTYFLLVSYLIRKKYLFNWFGIFPAIKLENDMLCWFFTQWFWSFHVDFYLFPPGISAKGGTLTAK